MTSIAQYRRIGDVLALLCARFPKTFFAYQRRRRPLKIGIHRELGSVLGETVERKLLHRAIRTYVVNYGYQQSQTAGAARIDLDGNSAGVVTEEEAKNAKRSLAGIKKQKRLEPREMKPEPKRDGLAALREAAAARRRQLAGGAA